MRTMILAMGAACFLAAGSSVHAQTTVSSSGILGGFTNPFAGMYSPRSSLPVASTPTSNSTMSSFFQNSMTNASFRAGMYHKPSMPQQINIGFLNFLPKMPNMQSTFLFQNSGSMSVPQISSSQVTPPTK